MDDTAKKVQTKTMHWDAENHNQLQKGVNVSRRSHIMCTKQEENRGRWKKELEKFGMEVNLNRTRIALHANGHR